MKNQIFSFPIAVPAIVALVLLVSTNISVGQLGHQGKLFLHGGGGVDGTISSFVESAGGAEARLVVIPTATSDDNLPTEAELKSRWRKRGIENVELLHTHDRQTADSLEFVSPIEKATAVFISGGVQQRLGDTYVGTETEAAMKRLLLRGGAIGGSSAGAAIMSKAMIASGGTVPKMSTGFDLLPKGIVDQHFLNRSRLNRLMNAVRESNGRTGVGIDERTCLEISGDLATVRGRGFVTLVRLVDDQVSVETFHDGDSFKPGDFGIVDSSRDGVLNLDVRGIRELSASGRPLEKLVSESIAKSLKLRDSFLQQTDSESRAAVLERLALRFADQYRQHHRGESPDLFDFSSVDFESAIRGTSECPTATEVFGPFEGKWYGRWADFDVDHHWSRVFEPDQHSLAADLSAFQVGWQYAWIGDGYGVNHCLGFDESGRSLRFLLGYTEHLQDGDFSKIVSRRPHVGIYAGPGRLIWITAGEVFFEEALANKDGRFESYSIIGFNYDSDETGLTVQDGFVTVYSSSESRRVPFRGYKFASPITEPATSR
ncbi:cyanophycinase [Mariniblastus fucicola]|uniref:Cyanophycinase n=1 Tax=Mariniblastus fucicola TaxID=980251 RepID=A0A5B9PF01_9BACT|nr:cyanophycinase [Mariniblastus fucicola]QEG21561.1 Cyanophycinase [Mariniblastus fucicola]